MIIKNGTFEIIDNDQTKKIKGQTTDGTYVEIRHNNGWLDILAFAELGSSGRSIYRVEVKEKMSIGDMIRRLDIMFE